jgi:amidase
LKISKYPFKKIPSRASQTNKSKWGKKQVFATSLALSLLFSGTISLQSANALTRLTSDSGTVWEIHDSFAPNLDTGSLRKVDSTQAQGFGNIFVKVSSSPEPIMNGQMMRGFGLTYDNENTFYTTQSVNLGDVLITREIYFDSENNRTRFFDTFTNTYSTNVTVDVSFGGSLGYGTTTNAAKVKATSTGDLNVTTNDSWIVVDGENKKKPIGIVLGKSASSEGGMTGIGNQQKDPFTTPLPTSGNDANFYGFINTLNIEPGESKSLVHYVQVGEASEDGLSTLAEQMEHLLSEPDLSKLSSEEICSISNLDLSGVKDNTSCGSTVSLDVPDAPEVAEQVTSSPYDVVNKTIAEMQQDMKNGITTSEQITRAYLDRIKAYDGGQLGFHSFLYVSETAIEQAKAADQARKEGKTGALLGIPIAIKDIYDTADMPTTGGTKALEGWQPSTDAYQVAKLREAGAVIIGKTNTSEFANSGSFSESGWKQTWNALYPSKTSFGSSGGSAVAIAADFAAAAMGSQTGVSLYAPTTGASLASFRGTDGIASVRGVMPLTWGQDYAGPIARTVTDLAYILNATTGTDPLDIFTVKANADEKRPEDWTDSLDVNALKGKKIGYIPSSFKSSYADDDTGQAVMDKFAELEAAGATMIELSSPPSAPTRPSGINASAEGWARYIELHDEFPFENGARVLASEDVLIYNKRSYTEPVRMTDEAVEKYIQYRTDYKAKIKEWMDENEVDAVVYAGFISDVYNNDAEASQLSSDRGTGVLTSNVGLPTVIVPVGVNDSGYSITMQLVGRAWDDAEILGMGYALEQQTKARVLTEYAPALTYVKDTENPPIEEDAFTDITNHWAKENINLLSSKGLLIGYPDGTFRPDKGLTRAEALKVIMTYLGEEGQASSFKDVPTTHWANQYIGKATQLGIINGYVDGTFRPDKKISRGELAALITRAFSLKGKGTTSFKDLNSSAWYYEYVDALVANKIVIGYADQTFKANKESTRAEYATIIVRLLENVNN